MCPNYLYNNFIILNMHSELGTLEWWISRSMLDPLLILIFLISRLTLSCITCTFKIQPIRVAYQKSGNLKFCAPFKINIQKQEGLSNFEKPVFDFLFQQIKSVHK